MSLALSLFLRTFVIGIAVAAPVGAMALLCIDRTLHRGWRAGMATGLGIATADGIYAAVAAFGVSAVSTALVEWQTPLRVVGGLALVFIGLRSALLKPSADCQDSPRTPSSHVGLYAGAVALTLTNPMTIIAFAAVFVSAGIAASPSIGMAAVATMGVAFGSLTWWVTLVTGSLYLGRGAGPGARLWLGRVAGIAIAAFGLLAAASVIA